ncbi:MAG: hypothetical protein Q4D02_04190 [Clostridia bacterium]|nr:hypothetical protein [Clostridia bacterium]
MLNAISNHDFKEFGCPNCGCDFAYNSCGISGMGAMPAKCGECNHEFVILADGLTESPIGFGTENQNEYYHPKLQTHPRKGTPKHKFVRPDLRPENGIGEFCSPRGVGYDLACFVKSKEAGQRIVQMFEKIAAKRKKKAQGCKCFVCGHSPAWLDYRPHEPLWIQVKIQYCSKHERNISVLSQLIAKDGIITEDKIMQAINFEETFENLWNFVVCHSVYNVVDLEFLQNLLKDPNQLTKQDKSLMEIDYKYHKNILAMFHSFGFYLQFNDLLKNNRTNMAYLAAEQYGQAISFVFNHSVNPDGLEKKTYLSLSNEIKEMLMAYPYVNVSSTYCDFKTARVDELTKKYQKTLTEQNFAFTFRNLWNKIIKMHVYDCIDIEYLRKLSDPKEPNPDFSDTDIITMFHAYGLYLQVTILLNEENVKMAAFAVEQFSNTLTSHFNLDFENQMEREKYKNLFMDLAVLLNSYWNKKHLD